jgi:hypothetical protein
MTPCISIHFLRHFPAVHSTRQIGNLRYTQESTGNETPKTRYKIYTRISMQNRKNILNGSDM